MQDVDPGVVKGTARYVDQAPLANDQDTAACAVIAWWSLAHLAISIRHVPVDAVTGPGPSQQAPARHSEASGPR